jgi:hypothetical protein
MLYSIDKNQAITKIPYEQSYKRWISRLSAAELDAITDELNQRINSNEVHTSSWMPGHDWTGTVFMPIYEKACGRDKTASAQCFGLILWKVMMDHPDTWSFGRYKLNDIPIEGLTYFRINI